MVLLTLGTGIGGGLLLRGEIYRGWINGGAEMGHMVVEINGRPCQGNCPNWGCLESVASGSALVREASLAVARRPDTALGHALEEGRELTGPLITEMATAGDPVARGAIETIGRALGVGITNLVNIFNPQVVVIGGGVIAAGELLLAPAREVMLRAGAQAGQGRRARRGRPLGPRGGHDRRGPAGARPARRGRHGRHRGASGRRVSEPEGAGAAPEGPRPSAGRLVVCPTPIGNLEDVTLRVLAALREADVVACEDTRHTRVLLERYGVSAKLVSLPRAQRARPGGELVEQMRAGSVVALVSDAGMPLVSDPGFPLVQGCVAAGLAVEVLPGPSAALTALVASALPSDVWRFAGFLPRKRGAAGGRLGDARDAGGVRVPAPHRRFARRTGRARPVSGRSPSAAS